MIYEDSLSATSSLSVHCKSSPSKTDAMTIIYKAILTATPSSFNQLLTNYIVQLRALIIRTVLIGLYQYFTHDLIFL